METPRKIRAIKRRTAFSSTDFCFAIDGCDDSVMMMKRLADRQKENRDLGKLARDFQTILSFAGSNNTPSASSWGRANIKNVGYCLFINDVD